VRRQWKERLTMKKIKAKQLMKKITEAKFESKKKEKKKKVATVEH
jgi:hypothetical protein